MIFAIVDYMLKKMKETYYKISEEDLYKLIESQHQLNAIDTILHGIGKIYLPEEEDIIEEINSCFEII